MRRAPLFVSFVLCTLTAAAAAGDEPHGGTFAVSCASCHNIHTPAGANLTTIAGNENLCASCHNLTGVAAAFAIERMSKADLPMLTGASHAWAVDATNPAAGATTPANSAMVRRLDAGKIICSTCHNQHLNLTAAVASGRAGTQNQSPVTKLAGSGTGTVGSSSTAVASAKGYLIEIVEVGGAAGTAEFRLSNDGGRSWWGRSGGSWVPYASGNAATTGLSVALNDGGNVMASFAGDFAIGDRFRFYVGYPFLRVGLDSGDNASGDKFCRDCHRSRTMDHEAVRAYDGSVKSHPVGQTLGANGAGYDLPVPLDANGQPQAGDRDGNPTNDLRLDLTGRVQCFTCHGVHHADGNTLSVDVP